MTPLRSTTHCAAALAVLIAGFAVTCKSVPAAEPAATDCATPVPKAATDDQRKAANKHLLSFANTADVLVAPLGTTQHVELTKDTKFQILDSGVATASVQTGNSQFLDIKGERQGDTRLRLINSGDCVDVGVIVKPPTNPSCSRSASGPARSTADDRGCALATEHQSRRNAGNRRDDGRSRRVDRRLEITIDEF